MASILHRYIIDKKHAIAAQDIQTLGVQKFSSQSSSLKKYFK